MMVLFIGSAFYLRIAVKELDFILDFPEDITDSYVITNNQASHQKAKNLRKQHQNYILTGYQTPFLNMQERYLMLARYGAINILNTEKDREQQKMILNNNLRFYKKFLKNNPNHAIATVFMAENYLWLGDKQNAQRLIDDSYKIAPYHAYLDVLRADFFK